MLKEWFDQLIHRRGDDSSSEAEKPQTDSASTLDTEKIKAIISELNAADQIFVESGFLMEKLEISLGGKAKVVPHFKQVKEISIEEQEQMLARVDNRSIIKFALLSLFKSSRIRALFDNTSLYFHEVTIDICSEPNVTTIFKRAHSISDPTEVTHH